MDLEKHPARAEGLGKYIKKTNQPTNQPSKPNIAEFYFWGEYYTIKTDVTRH